ncbi:SymE family type I addiction module toxin [Luteimonas huabeiensis]|uniref:SymE family type I addiction module toxin n=1 Tax=Luteimonas huabeiensis TaxID=1244513 RepID=UPI001F2C27F1|nr:SymE family type I addiction module toxin [Luteimonas huabeiensis]
MSRPKQATRVSSSVSEPASRATRARRDVPSRQMQDSASETSAPPLTEAELRWRARFPNFRTPVRCTMGYHYYDERRGDQVVGCAVPQLRLSGRWLAEHGFAVGDDLQVSVGRGVLLISRRRQAG